jgi:hypothetical protein
MSNPTSALRFIGALRDARSGSMEGYRLTWINDASSLPAQE